MFKQFMGYSIHRNGVNTGIAEYDFIITFCGRVAIVCRPYIRCQNSTHLRNRFNHIKRDSLGPCSTFAAGLVIFSAIMTNASDDLFCKQIEQSGNQSAGIVLQVYGVDFFFVEISRVQNFSKCINNRNDGFV